MIAPEFNGTPNTEEYRAYLALLLREVFIGTAETVPLDHAAGRILAQDVTARMDVPSFDNSQINSVWPARGSRRLPSIVRTASLRSAARFPRVGPCSAPAPPMT